MKLPVHKIDFFWGNVLRICILQNGLLIATSNMRTQQAIQ